MERYSEKKVDHKGHVQSARAAEQSPGIPGKVESGEDVVEGEVQVDEDDQERNAEGKHLGEQGNTLQRETRAKDC